MSTLHLLAEQSFLQNQFSFSFSSHLVASVCMTGLAPVPGSDHFRVRSAISLNITTSFLFLNTHTHAKLDVAPFKSCYTTEFNQTVNKKSICFMEFYEIFSHWAYLKNDVKMIKQSHSSGKIRLYCMLESRFCLTHCIRFSLILLICKNLKRLIREK